MQTYVPGSGQALLQTAFQTGTPITLSGAQIGSAAGFTPNDTMSVAQGTILVDGRTNPATVKVTPIHTHEMIFSVRLDQSQAFAQVGNVLLFANNQPFLWSVATTGRPKVAADPVAHFTGDEYYFATVFRYPYLGALLSYNPTNTRSAKFPVYDTVEDLPAHPEERPNADQVFVEQNTLWYGDGKPFLAVRTPRGWMSNPCMMAFDDKLNEIQGRKSVTGGLNG